ncbi:MAG: S49 family peptidase [Gammaproteobacteria bacterium]|nr:S49 family peptidase [Gammaproteobacteria bacterium]
MTDPKNETPSSPENRTAGWERDLLERFAFASLTEQRRARRWSIFFKLFFVIYLLFVLLMALSNGLGSHGLSTHHTALVELDGTIETDGLAGADAVITGLRSAFEDTNALGVIIRANSPGGSPVQAGYIYDEIKRLRAKYPKMPVYGVVTDVCASACYYALAATDKIYADRASIVGSIGVLMDGFGFVDTMKKFGVERRLLTAGENKGFLDPFSPMTPAHRERMKVILNSVHQQFIERVRDGRGQQLKETKDMYSGMFWTGEEALKLGLIDDFGSASFVAREVIGAEDLVDHSLHEDMLDRFTRQFGASIAGALGIRTRGTAPQLR